MQGAPYSNEARRGGGKPGARLAARLGWGRGAREAEVLLRMLPRSRESWWLPRRRQSGGGARVGAGERRPEEVAARSRRPGCGPGVGWCAVEDAVQMQRRGGWRKTTRMGNVGDEAVDCRQRNRHRDGPTRFDRVVEVGPSELVRTLAQQRMSISRVLSSSSFLHLSSVPAIT